MDKKFSGRFFLLATLFCVCLVTSNLYACKLFSVCGFTLSGAVVLFPVTYIINDCLAEVYGYRKARFVIWTAFAVNIFVNIISMLVVALPAASFWTDGEAFNYVFKAAPRATLASLLAFLAGSTLNAAVMSKMKVADKGKRFGIRAIVSSLAGETLDSLIFVPIVFRAIGVPAMLKLIAGQIVVKVTYEIIILPATAAVVRWLKKTEQTDEFDHDISYNPFKIKDI